MSKDILLHVLSAHFGVRSRLESGFPHHIILCCGDNEIGVPLNAPDYETFAPIAVIRIIERFEITKERLFTAYNAFTAAH